MKHLLLIAALWVSACAPMPAPSTPPTSIEGRDAEFTETCQYIWQSELGRDIDASGLAACLNAARHGATGEQIRDGVRTSAEYRDRQATLAVLAATAPSAGEHGWLRRSGPRILQEDGTRWRGKGFTDFQLFLLYTQGVDIQPLLTERISYGTNYLRVLSAFDIIGTLHPQEIPNYDGQLHLFLDVLAARGLRVEVVALVDSQSLFKTLNAQRAHVARIAAILTQHWNASGELCNECAHPTNLVDPLAFTRPTGPTLWSRGSNCCGNDGYVDPPWDLITHHSDRNDEWPRKVECRPITDQSGVPCLEDEPMGASVTNQPGRRSDSADDFGYLGGLCSLWSTAGCLFHSDAGLRSVLLSTIEATAAHAFFAGLQFAPPDAPSWPYQRGDNCENCPGIGTMPLAQTDLPAPAGTLRTACRTAGTDAYCVAVRPGPAWTPLTRDGWIISTQTGPHGAFLHLTR